MKKDYVLGKGGRVFLSAISEYLGFGIMIVAAFLAFMTLIIPVGAASDAFEVYVRNISTIICLLLLGNFFITWSALNGGKKCSQMKTNMYRTTTLVMAIASFIKAFISLCFIFKYMMVNNFIFLYYLGEVLVWGCCTFFFISYYLRLKEKMVRITHSSHHHHEGGEDC